MSIVSSDYRQAYFRQKHDLPRHAYLKLHGFDWRSARIDIATHDCQKSIYFRPICLIWRRIALGGELLRFSAFITLFRYLPPEAVSMLYRDVTRIIYERAD